MAIKICCCQPCFIYLIDFESLKDKKPFNSFIINLSACVIRPHLKLQTKWLLFLKFEEILVERRRKRRRRRKINNSRR